MKPATINVKHFFATSASYKKQREARPHNSDDVYGVDNRLCRTLEEVPDDIFVHGPLTS